MKKQPNHIIMLSGLLAAAFVMAPSCQKSAPADPVSQEIILAVADDDLTTDIQTKTTAVTSLPSTLYWGATTGSGSETAKWSSTSASVSASKIYTGKYQTASPTTYNYYVSNTSMSVGANTTVSVTGGTSGYDIVCGRASTNSVSPAVTLGHIFARTGSITTNVQNGNGSLSGISYTIVKKGDNTGTTGTYNLRTGAWSSCSGLTSATAITGSSDMYLIPGTYSISITATYTRGDYVVTQTKTGDVTFTAGKINNMTLTWPEGGSEIRITCTLTAWSSQAVSMTVQYNCPAVDMGGTSTVLYASWNVGASSETEFGDYFAWGETGKRYTNSAASLQNNNTVTLTGATFELSNAPYHVGSDNNTGWTKYVPSDKTSYWGGSGSPDNKEELEPSDDVAHVQWGGNWRMPSESELQWLVDNCTKTWQSNYNGSGIYGLLMTSNANGATLFFPCARFFNGDIRRSVVLNSATFYLSSSPDLEDPKNAVVLYVNDDDRVYMDTYYRYLGCSVRPVRPKP